MLMVYNYVTQHLRIRFLQYLEDKLQLFNHTVKYSLEHVKHESGYARGYKGRPDLRQIS